MIQVALCPSEIRRISQTDLSDVTAVVFDVLRATSSIITGLASGVEAIIDPLLRRGHVRRIAQRQPAAEVVIMNGHWIPTCVGELSRYRHRFKPTASAGTL